MPRDSYAASIGRRHPGPTPAWIGWLVLALTLHAVAAEPCSAPAGRMASTEGEVEIRRGGSWRPAILDESLCVGDTLRVAAVGRAAVILVDETVLRLDQGTTLTLSAVSRERPTLLDLITGAIFFLSRTPESLQVRTPFVNAAIEGTEFVVRVGAGQTTVSVLEGKVRVANARGELLLSPNEAATAAADEGPKGITLIRPRDTVAWALYYPPIIDFRGHAATGPAGAAIAAYRAGDVGLALSKLQDLPQPDTATLTLRAGLRLSVGQLEAATADIDAALRREPGDATAIALKSVIALTRNAPAEAMSLANQAVARDAASPVAHMARSYAEQARFDLPAARAAAAQAVELAPTSPLARARLAELWLANGETRRAVAEAQRATADGPELAHPRSVLGFAHLAEGRIDRASSELAAAIARDPAAPLPRLGSGLAAIRQGQLDQGVEQLTIAAALSPDNALVRSYLGKGYYEQRRDSLADVEYENAKRLDPNDPTPYFYQSILRLTGNRPVEALELGLAAQARNDNRAVFRSRLALDQDAAARAAAQGRIYDTLGFPQLGLVEGWKAVAADPTSFSAHRLLADLYANLPGHQIARASELLQSRLLQPPSLSPIQPQLTVRHLGVLRGIGPTRTGLNEYNPLFVSNGVVGQASILAGTQETFAEDLVGAALIDNLAFSVGQFHYTTEGFRPNNDQTQDIVSAFVQHRPTPELGLQVEALWRERDFGYLAQNWNGYFDPTFRQKISREGVRGGLHLRLTPRSDLLLSVAYESQDDVASRYIEDYYSDFRTDAVVDVGVVDLRYDLRSDQANLALGGGFVDWEQSGTSFLGSLDLGALDDRYSLDGKYQHIGAYGYGTLHALSHTLDVTLGLSVEHIDDADGDVDRLNPKLGVLWLANDSLTIRAAIFRTLTRPLIEGKLLEPTQVAGFNQYFYDGLRTRATRAGLGLDYRFGDQAFTGFELTGRDLATPRPGGRDVPQDELLHRAYFYWTPDRFFSLRSEVAFERYDTEASWDDNIDVMELRTLSVPLGASVFHPNGLYGSLKGTYVDQRVRTHAGAEQSESFWSFDLGLGYRLPHRRGSLEVQIKNLLDQEHSFQDDGFRWQEPQDIRFAPERTVLISVNLLL